MTSNSFFSSNERRGQTSGNFRQFVDHVDVGNDGVMARAFPCSRRANTVGSRACCASTAINLRSVRNPFNKHGISYELCKQPKSDLYRDLLPRLNSGQIILPRHDRLVAQICGLERRTGRSGKDSIDHAPNGHDDLANAVAGAAAATRSKYRYDCSLDWVRGA